MLGIENQLTAYTRLAERMLASTSSCWRKSDSYLKDIVHHHALSTAFVQSLQYVAGCVGMAIRVLMRVPRSPTMPDTPNVQKMHIEE